MISAFLETNIRPVHPFPARMAPSIVWDFLGNENRQQVVLDPMVGSGTTLVAARASGHRGIGCDTDPLALLIARAWCANMDPENLNIRAKLILERAGVFLHRLNSDESYPRGADEETRHFIDFWFDSHTRRELTALSTCIARVRSDIERNLLWCAFSRMIITKSSGVSLAMDVSHSRPHRRFKVAPVKPFDIFLKSASRVAASCPFSGNGNYGPPADIRQGDARHLPVKSKSVDVVITSPPYLNAIDYLRGHKLSLVWMGHNISGVRAIRSGNIGAEVSNEMPWKCSIQETTESMVDLEMLDMRRRNIVHRYVVDMDRVMKECARVLKRNARALFVIGDSAIRGVFIRNSEALIQLAEKHGMPLVSRRTRPIERRRRYLPPPDCEKSGREMQGRMREEVILEFVRN